MVKLSIALCFEVEPSKKLHLGLLTLSYSHNLLTILLQCTD